MNVRYITLVFINVILAPLLIMAGAVSAGDRSSPTEFISESNVANDIYLPILFRNYPLRVGFVTNVAGIDDNSFNAAQWDGVERAMDELNVDGKYLESKVAGEYEPNLIALASQGYDLTIASGFQLGGALANVAAQYSNSMFTITDFTYPDPFGVPPEVVGHDECIPNVQGQIFKVDQAAFLAGYLAAGMTETDKIGWFGGVKIPTVTIFGVGYQKGMQHYNSVHATNVQLLGWDNGTGNGLFTGDFVDQTKGKEATETLFNGGADIFMPVGGMIGEKGFDVARQRGGLGIWVDFDGYDILPGARDVMLTSAMKNLDNSVYDVIKATLEGNFNGCGDYKGDLVNAGVGIAPYHLLESSVPAWLKSEIEDLKAKIISGQIQDTGCISYPQYCPLGMY